MPVSTEKPFSPTRILGLFLVALSVGHVRSAADAAEVRIDRNFEPAAAPGPKVPAIAASELKTSKGSVTARIDDRDFELETLTVTPPGAGPFPLAVVSHGVPTRGGRDARRRTRIRSMLPVAEDFARRGYKAVVFARRGYASSDGPVAEGYGRCHEAHRRSYVWAAVEGAKDFDAVIAALAGRPDIDGSKVIAAGQSGGGFAASALAMFAPPGLIGIVNFAGGRGGAKKGGNCSEDGYVGAFGDFGKEAKVPALWLYSTTDKLFWPELVDRAFEAYASNGAPVRLDRVGPLWFTGNGHFLVALGGREFWRPRIDDFLNAIGAPNWKEAPDDAAVERLDPPAGMSQRGVRSWRRYLAEAPHKAVALGEDGRGGGSWRRDSLEEATEAAIRSCEKRSSGCRIVSVDGRMTQ